MCIGNRDEQDIKDVFIILLTIQVKHHCNDFLKAFYLVIIDNAFSKNLYGWASSTPVPSLIIYEHESAIKK